MGENKNKQIVLKMDGICLFNKIIQTETRISNQQYLTSKMLKDLKNKNDKTMMFDDFFVVFP